MTPEPRPPIRASDAEREAAADALRRHAGDGRLDAVELDERLSAVFASRTVDELRVLLADLPRLPSVPDLPAEIPKVGLPGRRRFRQQHVLPVPRPRAFREARAHLWPALHGVGFRVVRDDEAELVAFEREVHPAWVPAVVILFFPLGLFALAAKETERIVVSFAEHGDFATRIAVEGMAPRSVRRAFAQLSA